MLRPKSRLKGDFFNEIQLKNKLILVILDKNRLKKSTVSPKDRLFLPSLLIRVKGIIIIL